MIKYKFDPNIYNIIALNVKKYRETSNISLNLLSKYTGIKVEFLKEFENSKNKSISINELYKISKVLNVSIDKFFEN